MTVLGIAIGAAAFVLLLAAAVVAVNILFDIADRDDARDDGRWT